MPGLRERKKAATRKAIHDGAIRLFGEQGFAGTTIDQIAEAADVSRATVFHYFPTKESIVFGDAPQAIAALAALLEDAPEVVPAVREWLRGLTGWIEPDLQLQRRLAREVPDIAAHRLRVLDGIEDVVAEALTRELGAGAELAARLAAAALIAGFDVVEDAAVERMASEGRALEPAEIDALLDRRGRLRPRRDRGAARGLGLGGRRRLHRPDLRRGAEQVVLDDRDLDRGRDRDRQQRADDPEQRRAEQHRGEDDERVDLDRLAPGSAAGSRCSRTAGRRSTSRSR